MPCNANVLEVLDIHYKYQQALEKGATKSQIKDMQKILVRAIDKFTKCITRDDDEEREIQEQIEKFVSSGIGKIPVKDVGERLPPGYKEEKRWIDENL